jgi:hypothetical protein
MGTGELRHSLQDDKVQTKDAVYSEKQDDVSDPIGAEGRFPKVLIVAYHFPPTGGSGVFRTSKFVKYLHRLGWSIGVLTPKYPMFSPKDTSLLKDVPDEVLVRRTRALSTEKLTNSMLRRDRDIRWFLLPDPAVGWFPFGVLAGLQMVKREKFDVIYATAPFYTSFIVSLVLSLLTSIPLVLDFR